MRKYICEACATFIFIFVSVGCACAVGNSKSALIIIPLAFGLSFICSATIFSKLCCCHLNPVVSFAMLLDKKLDKNEFISYVIAQFVGSAIAVLLIALISSQCGEGVSILTSSFACNTFYPGSYNKIGIGGAFLIEIILTCFLIIAFLSIKDDTKFKDNWFFVIAGVMFLICLIGVLFTGTSVNPFRSLLTALIFGPIGGDITPIVQLPIFIIAPIIGSLGGVWLYRVFCENKRKISKTKARNK